VKKILAALLAFVMIFCFAFAEQPATPTDLASEPEIIEIADDDFGHIEYATPKVFLEMSPEIVHMGDEITLTAILMDFPEDVTIYWEYSNNCVDWFVIEGEHENLYTFILTPDNLGYYWRVRVHYEG